MFDTVLDALAEATGCDRSALGDVVGRVCCGGERSPGQLVARVAATERLVQAAQAVQLRDVTAFADGQEERDRADGCTDEALVGRTAAVEIGAALRLTTGSAQFRLHDARRAVGDHPRLLALLGTGTVSMAGLRKAMTVTDVLTPEQRRVVDAGLAADAVRTRLTPGRLEQAAQRRVLAVDPHAAQARAATARLRRRGVRLG